MNLNIFPLQFYMLMALYYARVRFAGRIERFPIKRNQEALYFFLWSHFLTENRRPLFPENALERATSRSTALTIL